MYVHKQQNFSFRLVSNQEDQNTVLYTLSIDKSVKIVGKSVTIKDWNASF